ncbi:MAG: EamA family transporter [Chloroherpetonaceae bacterium]|nr:DMT family transporter [Chloroherpetonaceae bacterium]MCS7211414.1 DMT family transporter [Chloroherpetonaceae bacterium]MDW8018844.1 EamA family transporter [Chloroherpetonaceae bacterium]
MSRCTIYASDEDRLRGIFYVALAALLWSTGGAFIKSVELDAFQTSFWRSLFATLTIAAITKPRHLTLNTDTLLTSLAYSATLMFFVAGTKLTTAANAILLQYAAPIYILLLAHFLLKESMNRAQVITVFFCVIGMAIFFLDQLSPQGYLGNIFAALSGVAFAVMTVMLRKQRHADPTQSIFLGNLWIVLITAFILITQSLSHPKGALHPDVYLGFAISTADSIIVAFLGIFQIGIPYLLFTRGIRALRAVDAALIGMLEPVLNPVWAFLIVGEVPSMYAFIGGAIIIVAVFVQNVWVLRVQQSQNAA